MVRENGVEPSYPKVPDPKAGGWTQAAFSRLIGVSPQFLCQVEMGRKQVSDGAMTKICSTLRITPKDLMGVYESRSAVDPDTIEIPIMFDDDERHERSCEMLQRFWALDRKQQNVLLQIADELTRDDMTNEMRRIASIQRGIEQTMASMILMAKQKSNA